MNGSRRSPTPCYPGKQFGNYRIIKLLGQGGFADVYLGEHVYLHTQAAIKILHTRQTAMDEQVFSKEARIAARLVHPHIARVLEFGVEGQIPFLVMDYAPNGTLRQRHPSGSRLTSQTVLKYMLQIAGAVQHIHDRGLIHRDIKPANMLLGAHDEVWLSDFGIAIAAHGEVNDESAVVGTLTYMAPEQIEGHPCLQSDQYALGVVVYEWLAGYPPFDGEANEIIDQHFNAIPPALYSSVPIVSQAVENVVFKALAKYPQDRFESVQAFATALQDAFEPPPLVIRSADGTRRPHPHPQPQPQRPLHLSSVRGQGQRQIQENPPEPEHTAVRGGREYPGAARSKGRKTWKEIAAFYAIDLLVSTALLCVLAGLNAAPSLIELLMTLCLVLLPLGGALIRRNSALFFLTCSIAVLAALIALLFHTFILLIVTYIGSLLLSLLVAFAVSVNEV